MLERACGYWSSCCPKRMSFSPRCVLCTRMKNCVKSGFSFYLPSFCFHYIVPSERGKCTTMHDCCGAKSHVRLTWSTVCMCVSSKLYNRSKNWIRKKLIKIEFFSLPEVNPLKQSALYTCKCSVPHRINRHAIYTLQAFSFLLCLSLSFSESKSVFAAHDQWSPSGIDSVTIPKLCRFLALLSPIGMFLSHLRTYESIFHSVSQALVCAQ